MSSSPPRQSKRFALSNFQLSRRRVIPETVKSESFRYNRKISAPSDGWAFISPLQLLIFSLGRCCVTRTLFSNCALFCFFNSNNYSLLYIFTALFFFLFFLFLRFFLSVSLCKHVCQHFLHSLQCEYFVFFLYFFCSVSRFF